MPTLTWAAATALFDARSRKAKVATWRAGVPRGAPETRRYRFIIPAPTWASETFDRALSVVSPRSELQLDPRTHTVIAKLLTDRQTSGFCELFVTFDQQDAFGRLTDGGNDYFDALSVPEAELAQPFVARAYLDLIQAGSQQRILRR